MVQPQPLIGPPLAQLTTVLVLQAPTAAADWRAPTVSITELAAINRARKIVGNAGDGEVRIDGRDGRL